MNQNNIFTQIQNKKNKVKEYANLALKNGWISTEEHGRIIIKLEQDKLVIGVIGQMKAGKSTFLNALVFQDDILPAATTPMTASLSVITYGAQKKIEAEFYTPTEWQELKEFANLPISEDDAEDRKSKIKAAKELIAKSAVIESEIPTLLGNIKSDDFDKLIQYVGADGRYVSITKSVKIEYPLDYLKGVEIVDTPGFNDPVASRELRTREFLKRTDAVVMLLYAGRAFDATDKSIIFDKVGSIGMGKILIGVNKYDLNYENGELTSEMLDNIREQLRIACEESNNSNISKLVEEQDPLLLSANMALMGKMDISKIRNDENWKFYYQHALKSFEISTQQEMVQKSLMPEFESALHEVIFKSKEEILIQKPINSISQAGINKLEKLTTAISNLKNQVLNLERPDEDNEQILLKVQSARKRAEKKISYYKIDTDEVLQNQSDEAVSFLKKTISDSLNSCIKKINDVNWLNTSNKKMGEILERELQDLEFTINNQFDRLNKGITTKLKGVSNDFIYDLGTIVDKYLEDFDTDDFTYKIKDFFNKNQIVNVNFNSLIYEDTTTHNGDDSTGWDVVFDFVGNFINSLSLGSLGFITGRVDRDFWKDGIQNYLNKLTPEYLDETIRNQGEKLKERVHDICLSEFITPLEEQLNDIVNKKGDKEQELGKAKSDMDQKNKEKAELTMQIEQMKAFAIDIK